jgi:AcrR family transcriptional regulator
VAERPPISRLADAVFSNARTERRQIATKFAQLPAFSAAETRMVKRPQAEASKPAQAGSDLPPAERIIEVARLLFCRDGIHATGIDRILSEAGASKMTLYTRFGSKEALVREVLLREGSDWRDEFFAAIEAAGPDPMQQLLQIVPALAGWFHSGRFYGCSFMNASAEHAKGDPGLRALAAGHHRHILEFLEARAEAAGYADPQLMARQILLTIDGAIAALMVAGDQSILSVADHNLKSILFQGTKNTNNVHKLPA